MIGAITGVLASRTAQYEYFTTILYPIITEDTITMTLPSQQDGELWYIPDESAAIAVPDLVSGNLVPTIVYVTYNETLAVESATVTVPDLVLGNLVPTIVYVTYNEPLAAESATVTVPDLLSGDLVTTIVYITYNEPLAAESATISIPELLSGTLI